MGEAENKKPPYDPAVAASKQLLTYLKKLQTSNSKKKKQTKKEGDDVDQQETETEVEVKEEPKELTHDLEIFIKFELLSMVPPKTVSDIASSIEAVQQRQQQYIDLNKRIMNRRAGLPEDYEDPSKKKKKGTKNTKKNSPSVKEETPVVESEQASEEVKEEKEINVVEEDSKSNDNNDVDQVKKEESV